jgi:hypothetical protein
MITEERLMAYVDGAVSAEERAVIDTALADDERLQRAVADERRLRRSLAELYDPTLEEELPERLRQLLEPADQRVVPFKQARPAAPRWGWQNFSALAASLVIGMFLGRAMIDGGGPETTGLLAERHLAAALQTQLAATQTPGDPIQVGISFVGPEGRPCRTFESADAAGLACRSGNRWQLRLLASKAPSPGSDYQRAGSASGLVMGSVQELIVGEPMDARQEREARDAGWPVRAK